VLHEDLAMQADNVSAITEKLCIFSFSNEAITQRFVIYIYIDTRYNILAVL